MANSTKILLFLSVWIVFLFHYNPNREGDDRYVFLTMSMAERHTLNIDPYVTLTNDHVEVRGHSYTDSNPGMSLIALPAWWLTFQAYKHVHSAGFRSEEVHFLIAHFVCTAVTSALASALTAVLLASLVYKRTSSTYSSIFTALIYSFGSIAFFFSCRTSQNSVEAFLMLVIYTLIFNPDIFDITNDRRRIALIGFCCGLSVLIDLPSLPMAAVFAFFAIRSCKMPIHIVGAIAAGALPIAVLMVYYWTAFHNPILPPQHYFTSGEGLAEQRHGLFGITAPSPRYMFAMLLSPALGLFVFMPFMLLAVWALITSFRGQPVLPREHLLAISILTLVHFVFIASSVTLQTQFGPRYLLPFIPMLCLVFGIYFDQVMVSTLSWRTYVVVALSTLSFVINIAGAEIGLNTANCFGVLGVWILRGPWLPVVNWLKQNAALVLGHDPGVLTPYGMLTLMCVILAALWLPRIQSSRALISRTDDPSAGRENSISEVVT